MKKPILNINIKMKKNILETEEEIALKGLAILLLGQNKSEKAIMNMTTQNINNESEKQEIKKIMKKVFDSIRETNEGAELIDKTNEANKYLDSALKLIGIYED